MSIACQHAQSDPHTPHASRCAASAARSSGAAIRPPKASTAAASPSRCLPPRPPSRPPLPARSHSTPAPPARLAVLGLGSCSPPRREQLVAVRLQGFVRRALDIPLHEHLLRR